jgi:hypothetical protein
MMGLRRLDAGDIGFGRWQHPLRLIAVVVNRAATGTTDRLPHGPERLDWMRK